MGVDSIYNCRDLEFNFNPSCKQVIKHYDMIKQSRYSSLEFNTISSAYVISHKSDFSKEYEMIKNNSFGDYLCENKDEFIAKVKDYEGLNLEDHLSHPDSELKQTS